MDSRNGDGDDGQVGGNIEHGLGKGNVLEAFGSSRLEGVAGPAGDGGQNKRVDEDGNGDADDDETIHARGGDAIEDGAHGHFGDGWRNQVGEGIGEQAFVEVDKVDGH